MSLLLLATVLIFQEPPADALKPLNHPLIGLAGDWELTWMIQSGAPASAVFLYGCRWEFDCFTLRVYETDPTILYSRYIFTFVDGGPHQRFLAAYTNHSKQFEGRGVRQLKGLILLDGDTLSMCLTNSDQFPTQIRPTPNDQQMYLSFERKLPTAAANQ